MGRYLPFDTHLEGMAWVGGSLFEGLLLERGMTCILRAVGQPQLQLGRKMSAGLASELGTRLGISFDGTKAAH